MAKPYYVPEVETHLIDSAYVDQTYQIQVMQPLMRKDAEERFPVLYLADGNDSFDVAKGISHGLHFSGYVRRYILVGIGYPGTNPYTGEILRARDFTPPRRREIPDFPRESLIEGVPGLKPGAKNWNGADDFLQFVRKELVPLIESEYPSLNGERGYFGHSLAGGLGLHALVSQAGLFNRYIISSPGVCWEGDPHGIEPAEQFIASQIEECAKVFLSVGGDEEFEAEYARSQFCSGFYRLAVILQKARTPTFEVTARLFPGESHATVWPLAFTHGTRAVFGPADGLPLASKS